MNWLTASLLSGLLATPVVAQPEDPVSGDRIYGRVVTAAGDVFEGYIRWDKNEGSWVDLLDGSKEMPDRNLRDAERLGGERSSSRRRGIDLFGIRIHWDGDEPEWPTTASTGIRFGHLRSIEVMGDDRALLVLKSGDEVRFRRSSTDIGDGIRGIVVDDPVRGVVELRWIDVELIDFQRPAVEPAENLPARLYGTLVTNGGASFTGYVAWDVDEILTSDVLDGDDEGGRRQKIPFSEIRAIERYGPDAARVVLGTGEELILDGTNDVNEHNGGILIADPALGQIRVGWTEFSGITFHDPPAVPRYEDFDGGRMLRGVVRSDDGSDLSGYIRWDNDEEYTWEILNGYSEGVAFDVEFGAVASIEKRGGQRCRVTLVDGRTFELEGSNDVDEHNKGIFVTGEDGETRLIAWDSFRQVSFERS